MRDYIANMIPPSYSRSSVSRPSPSSRLTGRRWLALVICGGLLAAALGPSLAVAAPVDEDAVLDAVTKLNKRALEEYDNLSFEQARKTLEEALAVCTKSGLDQHPIKARTHIHLGVVLLASGIAQRNQAIREFKKALAIQPDIKPNERVANPEVQAAFNEAKNDGKNDSKNDSKNNSKNGSAVAGAVAAPASPPAAPPAKASSATASPPAPPTAGLTHDAIRSGVKGGVIPVSVTTDPSLATKKVALWFRPGDTAKFVSVDLREYTPGNWSGSIPETATRGDDVAYFISAENEDGEVVGTHGSASAPLVIDLRNTPAVAPKKQEAEETVEEAAPTPPREEPTWFLGLAVGSGIGWTTGNGDVNNQDKVSPGFELSQLGHILPEVGFFVDPNLILSLQLRLQMVTGATPVSDPTHTMCGPNFVCEPASGAIAGLARLIWLFGEDTLVPYVSGTLGAGQIRHLATFPNGINCGTDPNKPVKCVDTVVAGPIFVGPGAGFILHVTPGFGVTLGIATLLGFPAFTFHVDVNAGVVVEL